MNGLEVLSEWTDKQPGGNGARTTRTTSYQANRRGRNSKANSKSMATTSFITGPVEQEKLSPNSLAVIDTGLGMDIDFENIYDGDFTVVKDTVGWRLNNSYSILFPKVVPSRLTPTSRDGSLILSVLTDLKLVHRRDNPSENLASFAQAVGPLDKGAEVEQVSAVVREYNKKPRKGNVKAPAVKPPTLLTANVGTRQLNDVDVAVSTGDVEDDALARARHMVDRVSQVKVPVPLSREEKHAQTELIVSDTRRRESVRAARDISKYTCDKIFKLVKARDGDKHYLLLAELQRRYQKHALPRLLRETLKRRILRGEDLMLDPKNVLFWMILSLLERQTKLVMLAMLDEYFGKRTDWTHVMHEVALSVPGGTQSGYDKVLQDARNALVHAENGNTELRSTCGGEFEVNPGTRDSSIETITVSDVTPDSGMVYWTVSVCLTNVNPDKPQRIGLRLFSGMGVSGVPILWSNVVTQPEPGHSSVIGFPAARGLVNSLPVYTVVPPMSYKQIAVRVSSAATPFSDPVITSQLCWDASPDNSDNVRISVLHEWLISAPDPVPSTIVPNILSTSLTSDITLRRKVYYAKFALDPNVDYNLRFVCVAVTDQGYGANFLQNVFRNVAVDPYTGVATGDSYVPKNAVPGVFTLHVQETNGNPFVAPATDLNYFNEALVLDIQKPVESIARFDTYFRSTQQRYGYLCYVTDEADPTVPVLYDMRNVLGLSNQAIHASNGNIRPAYRRVLNVNATPRHRLSPKVYLTPKAEARRDRIQRQAAQAILAASMDGSLNAAFDAYLQRQRNKMQHALNGNTTTPLSALGSTGVLWDQLEQRVPVITPQEILPKILSRHATSFDEGAEWQLGMNYRIYDPASLEQPAMQPFSNAFTHFYPAFEPGGGNNFTIQATGGNTRARFEAVDVAKKMRPPDTDDELISTVQEDIASWLNKLRAAGRQDNTTAAGFNLNLLIGAFSGGGTVSRVDECIMMKLVLWYRIIAETLVSTVDFDSDNGPHGYFLPLRGRDAYRKIGFLTAADVAGGHVMLDNVLTPGWAAGAVPQPTVAHDRPLNWRVTLEPERFPGTTDLEIIIMPNEWCSRFGSGKSLAILAMLLAPWPQVSFPVATNRTNVNGDSGLVQHAAWNVRIPGFDSVAVVFNQNNTNILPNAGAWTDYYAWGVPRHGPGRNAAAPVGTTDPANPNVQLDVNGLLESWFYTISIEDLVWVRQWLCSNMKVSGEAFDSLYEMSLTLTGMRAHVYESINPLPTIPLNGAALYRASPPNVNALNEHARMFNFYGIRTFHNPRANVGPTFRAWLYGGSSRSWNTVATGYASARLSVVSIDSKSILMPTDTSYSSGVCWWLSRAQCLGYSSVFARIGVSSFTLDRLMREQRKTNLGQVSNWLRDLFARMDGSDLNGDGTCHAWYLFYSRTRVNESCGFQALDRFLMPPRPDFQAAYDPVNLNYTYGLIIPATSPEWLWTYDTYEDYAAFVRPAQYAPQIRGVYGWRQSGNDANFTKMPGGDVLVGSVKQAMYVFGPNSFPDEQAVAMYNVIWAMRARQANTIGTFVLPGGVGLRTTGAILIPNNAQAGGIYTAGGTGGVELGTIHLRVYIVPYIDDSGLLVLPYSGQMDIVSWHEGSLSDGLAVAFAPKINTLDGKSMIPTLTDTGAKPKTVRFGTKPKNGEGASGAARSEVKKVVPAGEKPVVAVITPDAAAERAF